MIINETMIMFEQLHPDEKLLIVLEANPNIPFSGTILLKYSTFKTVFLISLNTNLFSKEKFFCYQLTDTQKLTLLQNIEDESQAQTLNQFLTIKGTSPKTWSADRKI